MEKNHIKYKNLNKLSIFLKPVLNTFNDLPRRRPNQYYTTNMLLVDLNKYFLNLYAQPEKYLNFKMIFRTFESFR